MEAQVLGVRRDDSSVSTSGAARPATYRITSEARSFTVETEAGNSAGSFRTVNTAGGPFPPGSYQQIAAALMENSGDSSGVLNFDFVQLDSAGNIETYICRQEADVGAGGTWAVEHDPNGGSSCVRLLDAQEAAPIYRTMPDQQGATRFYGLRTWSEDETMPGFPTPTTSVRTFARNPVTTTLAGVSENEWMVAAGGAAGAAGLALAERFL